MRSFRSATHYAPKELDEFSAAAFYKHLAPNGAKSPRRRRSDSTYPPRPAVVSGRRRTGKPWVGRPAESMGLNRGIAKSQAWHPAAQLRRPIECAPFGAPHIA